MSFNSIALADCSAFVAYFSWTRHKVSIGVNGKALVLATRYPMKTETQKETTESSKANAEAEFHEPSEEDEDSREKEADAMSKGNQLQLAEKWSDLLQAFPSVGYQNATATLLASPIVNWTSCNQGEHMIVFSLETEFCNQKHCSNFKQ